ncbi:MAG: VCBS repeat-containing protein [Patescibacteria group bacterium]
MRKLLLFLLLSAALFLLTPLSTGTAQLNGADFPHGRIIDDEIFTDSSTMTVAEIQEFFESKVSGGACDRNRPTYNDDFPPPYTCLFEFQQNPVTNENNYGQFEPDGTPSSVPGGISAAEIVWQAAQDHDINPQVLIVLLQKEQGLVTDNWPWTRQYSRATGYLCPDTAPCDPAQADFYKQVDGAANLFRFYLDNLDIYWYGIGQNNIYYHPDLARCGTKSINIENAATVALYLYTPYTPNQAALDNLYGTGDSCSAYGNRNFWRYFNDWFGSTSIENGNLLTIDSYDDLDTSWTKTLRLDARGNGDDELLLYGVGDNGRGNAKLYDVAGDGSLSLLTEHTTWRSNWDSIIPIDIDGDGSSELLFYGVGSNGRGNGEFYDLDGDGSMSHIKSHTTWRSNWDSIIPIDIDGDGSSELLFYRKGATKGTGEIYDIDENGSLSLITRRKSWLNRWQHIIPLNFQGNQATELLFYAEDISQTYHIGANGSLSLSKSFSGWRPTWELIVPVDIDGDSYDELIFYDQNGDGELYNVHQNSNFSSIRAYDDWSDVWTNITPLSLYDGDDSEEIFFYSSVTDGPIPTLSNILIND